MWNEVSVESIMLRGEEIAVVHEDTLFRVALEELGSKKLGAVCVTDEHGVLRGILTDGDVRRLVLKTQNPLAQLFVELVGNLATRNPISIKSNDTLENAVKLMTERRIWVLPVVDDKGCCAGLLHMQWILLEVLKS